MNIQALIKAIFLQIILINISSCSIYSIPLRKGLKTQTCVKNQSNLEIDKAEGFVISDLMMQGSLTTYKAFSYGGWIKVQSTQSQLQNLIGICTDISGIDQFSIFTYRICQHFFSLCIVQDISNASIIGVWLNSVGKSIDFVSSINSQTQSIDLSSITYLNKWFSFMVYLSKATNTATIKVSFQEGVYLTKSITVNTNSLFITYPNAWINVDIAYQNANYYNSCSEQKELYFHYSMDEDYTIDVAIYKQLQVKKDPFLLLELKEWESGRLSSYQPKQKLSSIILTQNQNIVMKRQIIKLINLLVDEIKRKEILQDKWGNIIFCKYHDFQLFLKIEFS